MAFERSVQTFAEICGVQPDFSVLAAELTPAEKAKYDVGKETSELFYLAELCCLADEPDEDLCGIFFQRAATWWSVTGGWSNVDKAILHRYPKRFIDILNFVKHSVVTGTFLKSFNAEPEEEGTHSEAPHAPSKASDANKAPAEAVRLKKGPLINTPADQPQDKKPVADEPTSSDHDSTHTGSQAPFDVEKVIKVLFVLAVKLKEAADTALKLHFDVLASMFWRKTGGWDDIDKSIFVHFPLWFIFLVKQSASHMEEKRAEKMKNDAKLPSTSTDKRAGNSKTTDTPSTKAPSENIHADKANFNVGKATQELYELAKKRFPLTASGRSLKAPSAQLESEFGEAAITWWRMTGGWKYVDDAIFDEYPHWFHHKMNLIGITIHLWENSN